MKTYLLLHDTDVLQEEVVPSLIEQMPDVEAAYTFFGSSVCFKTDKDVGRIYEFVKKRYPDLLFVLIEVGAFQAGSMPGAFWKFLKEPALASAAE